MVLASKLPLPDECIDIIVAYLADERQALHALVLSSQKLFQRSAPVLYRSPFQLIELTHCWSKDEKEKRSTALLALLLISRATATSVTATSSAPLILSYRHQQPRPATLDYLRFYILQYHFDLLRPVLNLSITSPENTHIIDRSRGIMDLQNEVAMALVQYRTEDIRVISQPIARAPFVLIPNLQRLRNLTRLELSEIPFNCKIEPVLEFIRVHDATHHTLKEIKIKGRDDPNRHLEPSHTQLIRLIHAMQTPQVVDARHWREAILIVDKIPSDCLQTLLLGMADMPPAYIDVALFLSECTLLEVLRMPVREDTLFAWAAANRKAMAMGRNNALTAASRTPSPRSLWQQQHTIERQKDLGRLRSIELCGEDRCLIPALRDAIDAFRDSLECLKAQSLALMMTTVPILNFMTLTWSWPLTRLSVLDLEGEVAFAFDFSALRLCPQLTTLRLSLPPYMYSTTEDEKMLEEMKRRMSQICLATRLLDLELQGKWPLSDALLEMMTRCMTRLTRLYIVSCSEYTMDGVLILIRGLERLDSLWISKWLCTRPPMRARMDEIVSLKPQLEVIEE